MLVLSRRPNEKILFPGLGITVEICSVSRKVVRIGIDAPPSIRIAREELAAADAGAAEPSAAAHQKRNRLHRARLAVHLARKQLQMGFTHEAEATLAEVLREYPDSARPLPKDSKPAPKSEIQALLVEDNHNESALLSEFLRLHGINVQTAHDGQEALDYLRSHERPDVILLDMRMPRCDGPATIAAIRGNRAYEDLKVFAVSGTDRRECSLPSGSRVDGWFTKPLNPTELVGELRLKLRRPDATSYS